MARGWEPRQTAMRRDDSRPQDTASGHVRSAQHTLGLPEQESEAGTEGRRSIKHNRLLLFYGTGNIGLLHGSALDPLLIVVGERGLSCLSPRFVNKASSSEVKRWQMYKFRG